MTPEMRKWLDAAICYGGSFVRTFAEAVICADEDNFELLRPVLLKLMEKYPHYRFTAVQKAGQHGDD